MKEAIFSHCKCFFAILALLAISSSAFAQIDSDRLSRFVDEGMKLWHLETFLVEYEQWSLREFAEFRIGPDGKITSLELFGESLSPVENKR